tara:strand:- start:333 stop:533 length:201 start_codon:yes stop_codon:yes gene_type:complete
MKYLDKDQGVNIITQMVEQVGIELILEELIQGMSSDELTENVKHLDRHLFANHFSEILDDCDSAFD